jgi:hypothetical protein
MISHYVENDARISGIGMTGFSISACSFVQFSQETLTKPENRLVKKP